VKVSGSDANQVIVHMIAHGSEEDLANARLEAFQQGNAVTVTMREKKKGGWFNWTTGYGDSRIEVTVPRRYEVNVHTAGGDLELRDTTGSATLRTSGGDIVAKNLSGNVEAKTSGGAIHADIIHGDVHADTSGGDIRLLNIDGKIRGQTSGGDVQCSLVGSNRGILVTTSGGSIQVTVPRSTAANIEAATSGGDFSSDLAMVTTERRDGFTKGSINGGGQPIEARTSGGDISLRGAN
jgi:DUF4097 and DUF4098 domain-containing protein YvlB